MPRYVIEREMPKIGESTKDALCAGSRESNQALQAMRADGKNIQWEHSYVTDDKLFCIYQADNEALVQEHAEKSGFPAHVVTPVRTVIDPVTAEG